MTKKLVVLFLLTLFASCSPKETASKKIDSTENVKDSDTDEDDSANIQIVHHDTTIENLSTPSDDEIPFEQINTNSSNSSQNDTSSDLDIVIDSNEITLETKLRPQIVNNTSDHNKSIDLSDQEAVEIVIEHVTEPKDTNEDDSSASGDNNNSRSKESSWITDWRSAENTDKKSGENTHSDHIETGNEESVLEAFDSDYSGEDRMEVRKPATKERGLSPEVRQFTPVEERGFLDSAPVRSIAELVMPRYRPVLTRGGIVYRPTLFTMQTVSPALPTHAWHTNIPTMHQMSHDSSVFSTHRHTKKVGVTRYEHDSKIIDDYSDYGTYSYTPAVKVTTKAPPQQIMSPNNYDVFKKLAEASSHPKSGRRTLGGNPGNFFTRQFSENFGAFDLRRLAREYRDKSSKESI